MWERVVRGDWIVSRYKCRKCGGRRVEVVREPNRREAKIASKKISVVCLKCGRKVMVGVPHGIAYRMSHKLKDSSPSA